MPEHKRRPRHEDPQSEENPEPTETTGDSSDGSGAPRDVATAGDATAEQVQNLQQQLDQVNSKASEYFEGWQRERADFSNYRKRVERDQAQAYQNAVGSVVKKYLVVVDDLARALKTRPTGGESGAWAEGVDLVYRKLLTLLESEGVHSMKIKPGEMFDPNREEAISHEENPEFESGQIIEVVQDGYLLGDRILRPALVRVAR